MLERVLFDIRHAVRGLARAKGFTAAAVLTLVVGLTGTTVMYALVQGVLLRPLPVRGQDRVIVASRELALAGFAHYPFRIEPAAVDAIRDASRTFERVAGVGYNGAIPFPAIEGDAASYISAAYVTGDFFAVLGVEPVLGRAFTTADDTTGAEPVLVITHGLWQRRYGAARDVIGRRLIVAERPFTIVGVMPPDLDYPRGVEAWRTVGTFPRTPSGTPFRADLDLVARLRPGATMGEALADLQALTTDLRLDSAASLGTTRGLTLGVRPLADMVVGEVRGAMFILFVAVGLVLIIATANVANLLLMRGEGRYAELAVRAALGAGRVRLARQFLAESLVLTIVSGALALLLTWWSLNALVAFVPDGLPRIEAVRIDAGVVAFSILVAFVASALAGFAPAVSTTRADLLAHLRGRRIQGAAARTGQRLLVVMQVALAVTVVAAAGLLTRTLVHMQTVEMGLAADRLVFVEIATPSSRFTDRARHLRLLDDIVARLEAVPGVDGATPVHSPPYAGDRGWDTPRFTAEGQDADGVAGNPALNLESIQPNYFSTVGATIVRGRAFTAADREGAPNVAIVSEDVAAHLWPGQDPIGRRLKMGGVDSSDRWKTVVGVASPTRYRELVTPRPTLYLPAHQFTGTAEMIVVRTAAPIGLVAAAARESVAAADPAARLMRVVPFAQMLDGPLARPRFNAFVLTVFGVAALSLAMVGLYAMMSAYVRQRYAEIGVRMALGATAADVRRLIAGEGLRLAGLGAVLGLAGALGGAAVLRGLLSAVHPLDPATLLGTTVVMVLCCAAAVYMPVRRATRIDPVSVLRSD